MNNREKQEHSAVETAQTDTQTAQEILDNGKPVRAVCLC